MSEHSHLEVAITQLESWIDNKAKVGLVIENGFTVALNEHGTLDHFEALIVFKNSVATVMFNPRDAIPEVRFEDNCYQVRLKYDSGCFRCLNTKRAGQTV